MATYSFPKDVESFPNFLEIQILESPDDTPGDTIHLYMPAQPKETLSATYDTLDSRLARSVNQSKEEIAAGLEQLSMGNAEGIKALAEQGIDAVSNVATDIVADNEIVRAISASTVKLAGDPALTYAFKTMEHRSFQFSFNMIATNSSEAQAIKDIVKSLKLAAAPDYVGGKEQGLIRYPDTIRVKYKNDEYLHKFRQSVIKTVDVTYNTLAADKFTTFEGGAPLGVQLDLTFEEMAIVTKKFIREGDRG